MWLEDEEERTVLIQRKRYLSDVSATGHTPVILTNESTALCGEALPGDGPTR